MQLGSAGAVALLLFAPLAGATELDFLKDIPGQLTPLVDAGRSKVGTVEVRSRTCVSKKKPAELKAHFREQFLRANLYIAPELEEHKLTAGEQVTGLDTENLLSYTVLLQANGKNTTIVFGVANLADLQPSKEPPFAPVYPGAQGVLVTNTEGTRALTYSVKATPAQIKEFYRTELGRAGFKEEAPLTYRRGDEAYVLTVGAGVTERSVLLIAQPAAGR